ncbi:hypothetical protein [Streptomyces sp. NBC_01013]|uniref:hypothetical protein n=1 Tax=Streptomyces sp. NBC_01013 TaxID=2903718 RepID=UPI003864CBAB|nr:hypothetical protein OG538_20260 [Streptomyces sp. NBC_01013]
MFHRIAAGHTGPAPTFVGTPGLGTELPVHGAGGDTSYSMDATATGVRTLSGTTADSSRSPGREAG